MGLHHLKVYFDRVSDDSKWVSGYIGNKEFQFYAKVEDEACAEGINGGRVVKLTIKKGEVKVDHHDEKYWDNVIVNYDRAWNVNPNNPTATEVYFVILDELEEIPPYEERIYGGSALGKVIGKAKEKLSGLRGSRNGA